MTETHSQREEKREAKKGLLSCVWMMDSYQIVRLKHLLPHMITCTDKKYDKKLKN